MGQNDVLYFRVPGVVVDRDEDVLVASSLSFINRNYFTQRKFCGERGSEFLTPLEYFQIREYALRSDTRLVEVLLSESRCERFDQIVNLKSDPPLVLTRPVVDTDADTFSMVGAIEAPYLKDLEYRDGFVLDDLNTETGLPERVSAGRFDDFKGYRVSSLWLGAGGLDTISDREMAWCTPMIKNSNGDAYLDIDINFLDGAKIPEFQGVRETYLATDENLERLQERIVA